MSSSESGDMIDDVRSIAIIVWWLTTPFWALIRGKVVKVGPPAWVGDESVDTEAMAVRDVGATTPELYPDEVTRLAVLPVESEAPIYDKSY